MFPLLYILYILYIHISHLKVRDNVTQVLCWAPKWEWLGMIDIRKCQHFSRYNKNTTAPTISTQNYIYTDINYKSIIEQKLWSLQVDLWHYSSLDWTVLEQAKARKLLNKYHCLLYHQWQAEGNTNLWAPELDFSLHGCACLVCWILVQQQFADPWATGSEELLLMQINIILKSNAAKTHAYSILNVMSEPDSNSHSDSSNSVYLEPPSLQGAESWPQRGGSSHWISWSQSPAHLHDKKCLWRTKGL